MSLHNRHNRRRRSGMSIPEWCCILGFLGLGLFMVVGLVGKAANERLQTTATGVGDLSQLPNNPIFRNTGKSNNSKGNNGVGNGVDDQPPGNPPVNDGPGTSPGNPGNKGGKKSKGKW